VVGELEWKAHDYSNPFVIGAPEVALCRDERRAAAAPLQQRRPFGCADLNRHGRRSTIDPRSAGFLNSLRPFRSLAVRGPEGGHGNEGWASGDDDRERSEDPVDDGCVVRGPHLSEDQGRMTSGWGDRPLEEDDDAVGRAPDGTKANTSHPWAPRSLRSPTRSFSNLGGSSST
jgi:hypothetical protein